MIEGRFWALLSLLCAVVCNSLGVVGAIVGQSMAFDPPLVIADSLTAVTSRHTRLRLLGF